MMFSSQKNWHDNSILIQTKINQKLEFHIVNVYGNDVPTSGEILLE